MNTIKFSHDYPKLWGQKTSQLVAVNPIPFTMVGDKLREYDTKTKDGTYYELPRQTLIHLTFIGGEMIPFCTLRRWTAEKYEYYKSKIGQQFKIQIDDAK